MSQETINERKALRKKILSDLYDHHFRNKGLTFNTTVNDLDKEIEEKLAYDYLQEKGYIDVVKQGQQYLQIRITADGIDAIENKVLS